MSIEGQGHFFTIYFPGFVCFVLYLAKISGERLQDHWSSGLIRYCLIDLLKFYSRLIYLLYSTCISCNHVKCTLSSRNTYLLCRAIENLEDLINLNVR